LKEALDWARKHQIEFIIDHNMQTPAYYHVGAGIVALSDKIFHSKPGAVSALTHEIRHAWQDYHGLIPTGGTTFAGYFIRLGLIEADAAAHGSLAEHQYHQGGGSAPTDGQILWKGFCSWYSGQRAKAYGRTALGEFAQQLGIPGIARWNPCFEYTPFQNGALPAREGIGISNAGEVRPLGKNFSGINYFNQPGSREFFARKILSPAFAAAFYRNCEELPFSKDFYARHKLTDEIRKRLIQRKYSTGQDTFITIANP
jgi:hypothetical protein